MTTTGIFHLFIATTFSFPFLAKRSGGVPSVHQYYQQQYVTVSIFFNHTRQFTADNSILQRLFYSPEFWPPVCCRWEHFLGCHLLMNHQLPMQSQLGCEQILTLICSFLNKGVWCDLDNKSSRKWYFASRHST